MGGGSAPGFGHAYYSRRAAVANNASSDRDSFLPSLFRGGADNASSGDQNVQQQLQGGLAGEVATAGWKEERSRKAKLRWVDALNTWVPEKKVGLRWLWPLSTCVFEKLKVLLSIVFLLFTLAKN